MSAINFEIKLRRENKIYYENELLVGCVQFNCPAEAKHDGITLSLEGIVNLQLSGKHAGLFEAVLSSLKPIVLLQSSLDLSSPGRLPAGRAEYHFEFPLSCKREPRLLYETYHGIFININYLVRCDVRRNSFLAKSLTKTQPFWVQYQPAVERPLAHDTGLNFTLSPELLQKSSKEQRVAMPRFLITGRLDSAECCVTRPLTGSLEIQHTEAALRSIELQLVRVETCGCEEGYAKEATEIQIIQIADGNVCPRLELPIYMRLPRLFTCPTLITKNFRIEFELNIIVVFKEEYVVTKNFPIVLKRWAAAVEHFD